MENNFYRWIKEYDFAEEIPVFMLENPSVYTKQQFNQRIKHYSIYCKLTRPLKVLEVEKNDRLYVLFTAENEDDACKIIASSISIFDNVKNHSARPVKYENFCVFDVNKNFRNYNIYPCFKFKPKSKDTAWINFLYDNIKNNFNDKGISFYNKTDENGVITVYAGPQNNHKFYTYGMQNAYARATTFANKCEFIRPLDVFGRIDTSQKRGYNKTVHNIVKKEFQESKNKGELIKY